MSTRSNIGFRTEDGKIKVIGCHWDGYLKGVGQTLLDNYDKMSKIEDLFNLGDISSLGKYPVSDPKMWDFDYEKDHFETFKGCIAYKDRGETGVDARTFDTIEDWTANLKTSWAEFAYLFQQGTWFYSDCSSHDEHCFEVWRELTQDRINEER